MLDDEKEMFFAFVKVEKRNLFINPMKHFVKVLAMLVAISAIWSALLRASIVSNNFTWLLPVYFVISLGCYGLLMVGIGLMMFPTCPQEAALLQKDIAEAVEFLKEKGVDVSSHRS